MYKNTDVLSIGTEYTVADRNGKIIKNVQIMTQGDILDAALGPYTEEFGSYEDYLEKSRKVLSGFDNVDYGKILWYASLNDEVVLAEVIEYAVRNNYDRIILEHVEDLE